MKVLYAKTVIYYIQDLTDILYLKNYFGFHHSAKEYTSSLMKGLEATIHLKQKRRAPQHFSRHGDDLWFVSYPKNKRTTWYFFFTHHPGDIYYIRYISNNHLEGQYI